MLTVTKEVSLEALYQELGSHLIINPLLTDPLGLESGLSTHELRTPLHYTEMALVIPQIRLPPVDGSGNYLLFRSFGGSRASPVTCQEHHLLDKMQPGFPTDQASGNTGFIHMPGSKPHSRRGTSVALGSPAILVGHSVLGRDHMSIQDTFSRHSPGC